MAHPIKALIAILLGLSIAGAAFASEFCDGFERGYVTGYKEAKNTPIEPFVPFCPIQPTRGFGDPESDYEHGYVIGYKQGLVAGSR